MSFQTHRHRLCSHMLIAGGNSEQTWGELGVGDGQASKSLCPDSAVKTGREHRNRTLLSTALQVPHSPCPKEPFAGMGRSPYHCKGRLHKVYTLEKKRVLMGTQLLLSPHFWLWPFLLTSPPRCSPPGYPGFFSVLSAGPTS